jgi:hypothetical protein
MASNAELCAELERVGMERVKQLRDRDEYLRLGSSSGSHGSTGAATATTTAASHEDTMIKDLCDIITDGNEVFKEAHGRNMTYSEMRSLYG